MRGGIILVVEDDDGTSEAIESLLDAAGFATSSYASAEALLAVGCVKGAVCVVSDIKLPAMSGLELVTELRLRSSCPRRDFSGKSAVRVLVASTLEALETENRRKLLAKT